MGVSQKNILETKCSLLLEQVLDLEREKNEREEAVAEFLQSIKPGKKISRSEIENIRERLNDLADREPESSGVFMEETTGETENDAEPYEEDMEETENSYELFPVGSIVDEYPSARYKIFSILNRFKFPILAAVLILMVLGTSAAVFYINDGSMNKSRGYIDKLVTESVSVATEDITGTILNSENIETITKQVKKNMTESLLKQELSGDEIELISNLVTEKTTEILQGYSEESKALDAKKEKELAEKITVEIMGSVTENLEQVRAAVAVLMEKIEKMQTEFSAEIDALQDKIAAIKFDLEKLGDRTDDSYKTLEKLLALEEQLKNIKNHVNDTSQYDALREALNTLDKKLLGLIDAIDLESLNAAMKSFALSISDIDSRLLNMDSSMTALGEVFTANLNSVDEELRVEIEAVLNKMKKLSEDVYDKSIVDSHIQNIQNSLDNIYAGAGELDAELQDKFLQAQKDLEALKQETESGYYDKIAVNNQITEIRNSLAEGLAELSGKADADLKDVISKVETNLEDFGINVETAYKQAINAEVIRLKGELQASIDAAAEAGKQNSDNILNLQNETVNIGNSISRLVERLNTMDGEFTDLKAQLVAVKNNIQYGYYSKEQMDALMTNIQTALDTIKTDVNKNSDKASANAAAITDLQTSLGSLNNSLNEKTEALQTNINNLGNNVTNLGTRVDNCFQSVSDGKRILASAITGKGIDTPADASFQQMANNVKGLVTMSSNPSVLFDTSSWTAPYDCIAVMSWSVNWKANHDYKQKATVTLSGVKSWDMGWGGTHDSSWHDYGGNGNVTWQARAGQTYALSFSTTSDSQVLTWGWNSRTWIVPGTASRSAVNSADSDSYINKVQKLERSGEIYESVPWKEEEKNVVKEKEEAKEEGEAKTKVPEVTTEVREQGSDEKSVEEEKNEITTAEPLTEEQIYEEVEEQQTEINHTEAEIEDGTE